MYAKDVFLVLCSDHSIYTGIFKTLDHTGTFILDYAVLFAPSTLRPTHYSVRYIGIQLFKNDSILAYGNIKDLSVKEYNDHVQEIANGSPDTSFFKYIVGHQCTMIEEGERQLDTQKRRSYYEEVQPQLNLSAYLRLQTDHNRSYYEAARNHYSSLTDEEFKDEFAKHIRILNEYRTFESAHI